MDTQKKILSMNSSTVPMMSVANTYGLGRQVLKRLEDMGFAEFARELEDKLTQVRSTVAGMAVSDPNAAVVQNHASLWRLGHRLATAWQEAPGEDFEMQRAAAQEVLMTVYPDGLSFLAESQKARFAISEAIVARFDRSLTAAFGRLGMREFPSALAASTVALGEVVTAMPDAAVVDNAKSGEALEVLREGLRDVQRQVLGAMNKKDPDSVAAVANVLEPIYLAKLEEAQSRNRTRKVNRAAKLKAEEEQKVLPTAPATIAPPAVVPEVPAAPAPNPVPPHGMPVVPVPVAARTNGVGN